MNCNGIWPYNGIPHDEFWTETWANYLSKQYFGERWFGMEIKLPKQAYLYYPSKNISTSFLVRKFLLPFDFGELKNGQYGACKSNRSDSCVNCPKHV